MGAGSTITLTFAGDSKSLERTFDRLGKKSEETGRRFDGLKRGAKVAAVGVVGALALVAKNGIAGASDLNEALNKSQATFRKSGDAVEAWSKKANTAFGMTRTAALDGAASIGAMLGPMGIADKQSADMSRSMVQLAADMGSFNNEDPSEMLDRIRAGLSGESEPLRRFGSNLSDARVKAFAYASGIAKVGEELTDSQKVQARYGLLLKDTKRQQGDFAKTSDGLANKQRILRATFQDLQTNLVAGLLPAFQGMANILGNVLGWMQKHETITKILVGVLAGLAVGVLAVEKAIKLWQAAQVVLNAVLSANPIGLVIVAIAALTAGVVIAYKRSERFRDIVQAVWSTVKTAVGVAVTVIRGYLSGYIGALRLVIGTVREVYQAVSGFFGKMVGVVKAAPGKIASAAVGMFDGIKNAFRSAINFIIRGWNRLHFSMPSIDTHIPGVGKIGGFNVGLPQIPELAKGGIVTSPTVALIGEAGPEAVIPLSRGRRGGTAGAVTVNVYDRTVAGMSTDARRRLARDLAPEISRYIAVGV